MYTISVTAITQPQVAPGWKGWTNFFILAPPSSVQSFDLINVSWVPSSWNLYNFFFATGKITIITFPDHRTWISSGVSLWLALIQLHMFKLCSCLHKWKDWEGADPPGHQVTGKVWCPLRWWSRMDFQNTTETQEFREHNTQAAGDPHTFHNHLFLQAGLPVQDRPHLLLFSLTSYSHSLFNKLEHLQ